MKLKDRGVNIEQKIAIFRRGEGSEELFFERGNIINHVHEFYRNYWHPKNIERLVDKGVNHI